MKTFRVHLKSGSSFTVTAHHFENDLRPGLYQTVPFYKDENTLDETILIIAAEVAAIVVQEPSEQPQLPGSTGFQSY